MMSDLIRNGMPPAEARFHAATALSDASYSELADAFGVAKGSISSAAGDARDTIRNSRNLFLRFVDGPKRILEHITFGGSGFSLTTHHYIVRYHGEESTDSDEGEWGRIEDRYGVIELKNKGKYNDVQTFESFDITRYETIDDLATDYYGETLFEDIHDAYTVRELLLDEGTDERLIEPEERLTLNALDDMLHRNGMVYAVQEETDSMSMMEGFDGPIEYDETFVDVCMGRQMGEYSVRDAASGAEVDYVENEHSPHIATLYEEVGPRRY